MAAASRAIAIPPFQRLVLRAAGLMTGPLVQGRQKQRRKEGRKERRTWRRAIGRQDGVPG
ncbi:hypothetical protein GCM10007242_30120 [Pigmentiphaga litoralis]|nr:hypothetical protein GCM10007242_30120 [Pigmentiphaga litoralis]